MLSDKPNCFHKSLSLLLKVTSGGKLPEWSILEKQQEMEHLTVQEAANHRITKGSNEEENMLDNPSLLLEVHRKCIYKHSFKKWDMHQMPQNVVNCPGNDFC